MVVKKVFLLYGYMALAIFFCLNLVSASHIINSSTISFNEDTSNIINISINNTDMGQSANITQVDINLYGNFNFSLDSSGTDAPFETFTNTSTTLTWINSSGFLINGSELKYFWFNLTSYTPGLYNITILTKNITDTYSTNISITVKDTTPPLINITYPINTTYAGYITLINYTAIDLVSLSKCWYSNDSGVNNFSIQNSGTNFSNVSTLDGLDSLTVYCNDSSGNIGSSNISFSIDRTNPQIILVSPDNSTNWSSSTPVTFTYRVSDVSISTCSLLLNYIVDQTIGNITVDTPQIFTKTMSSAYYNWSVQCVDNVGHTGSSETRRLRVFTTFLSSSDDDGDGSSSVSFWTNTQAISDKQFTDGYSQLLAKKYRVMVTINKKFYYIGIADLTATKVTMNISSTTLQAVLGIGEERKFDINNDRYNEIYVRVNSIASDKVNLTIKKINESVTLPKPSSPENNLTHPPNSQSKEMPSSSVINKSDSALMDTIALIVIVIMIFMIIIILSIYFVTKNKLDKIKHKTKIKVFDF